MILRSVLIHILVSNDLAKVDFFINTCFYLKSLKNFNNSKKENLRKNKITI